jgi:hypothetical protein
MESARISVNRLDERDVRDRQIIASIDGEHIATLLFGETVTREVPPGKHKLLIHNTLFRKRVEVDLRAGEHARFNVVNRASDGIMALLVVFGAAPYYLTVERQPD